VNYNIWRFIWDSFDLFYSITGLRAQVPIEYFYPNLCQWLFAKMTGIKGVRVEKKSL